MMASEAGKGDSPRPVNAKAFGDNYDAIFRKPRLKESALSDAIAKHGTHAGKVWNQHDDGSITPAVTATYLSMQDQPTRQSAMLCGNCKHYTQRLPRFPTMQCSNQDVVIAMAEGPIDGAWLEPSPDFGCNMWELRP